MLEKIREAVLVGDLESASSLTKKALDSGVSPEQVLKESLIAAMDIVGQEFETGVRYIPEMLISAEAMKASMELLRPQLLESGVESRGKVVIGTVEGDLHDIGKDLVATLLEGAGFEILDLGVEVSAQRFVDAVREHEPHVVAMSALLTTTMIHMPEVIRALEETDLRKKVRIVVGGAPITKAYAAEIGADGYAADASSAVALVKGLIPDTKHESP